MKHKNISTIYTISFLRTCMAQEVEILPRVRQGLTNSISLHWRHNDHDSVSNRQPHGCLLNRLFRRRSKKTSTLRVTGLCVGNSPGPVNSPHKGPVTRKMFSFDDVIMSYSTNIMHYTLSRIAYAYRENRDFVFIIIAQFMMSANSRIRFGLQIVSVCFYITPSHHHHCTNLSEDIELIKCLSDIFCQACE